MFKLFDYKLWLIVGLIFLVLYLYFELNNVKAKLEKFENSKDNLPKNLQDITSQSAQRIQVNLPPISTPSEVINMGNLKETKIILKGDENHQSSKEEDDSDSSSTSSSDSDSDHDDLTSDYPIYSNDNENADEIISINVTENIGEDVQKILEEALMEKEEQEEKIDEVKELNNVKVEEKVNSKVLLENSEEKQIEKLDLEKLDKLKKDDLTSLALKYQISLIKTENGKMKNKTKKELIDEILIQNNL